MQSPLLDTWAASLNDMTYPAQRWQAWVSQLDSLLSSGKMVTSIPSFSAGGILHAAAAVR